MKYRYVFLLGRAGCGKSAVYRALEARILASGQARTLERIDDFPQFWAMFLEDDAREKEGKARLYSRPTEDGDYVVTHDAIWDEALKAVNAEVLKSDAPDHMVFIEFARSCYVDAVQNFDRRILERCIAIFIQVSFETCWARNLARHRAAVEAGGDDHLVSREEMERSFLNDDQEAFVAYMKARGIPVAVVDNEAEGEAHLVRQVEAVMGVLF